MSSGFVTVGDKVEAASIVGVLGEDAFEKGFVVVRGMFFVDEERGTVSGRTPLLTGRR